MDWENWRLQERQKFYKSDLFCESQNEKRFLSIMGKRNILFSLFLPMNLFSTALSYLSAQSTLKLVSTIIYQIFIFTEWCSRHEKCFLSLLKSSFHSWDIQIFHFLSSPPFLLVTLCFSGWSKINMKVYDIFNCYNKNLITRFIWYSEKKKMYHIEIFSSDRILNKEHLWKSHRENVAPKASPRPFFNFGK